MHQPRLLYYISATIFSVSFLSLPCTSSSLEDSLSAQIRNMVGGPVGHWPRLRGHFSENESKISRESDNSFFKITQNLSNFYHKAHFIWSAYHSTAFRSSLFFELPSGGAGGPGGPGRPGGANPSSHGHLSVHDGQVPVHFLDCRLQFHHLNTNWIRTPNVEDYFRCELIKNLFQEQANPIGSWVLDWPKGKQPRANCLKPDAAQYSKTGDCRACEGWGSSSGWSALCAPAIGIRGTIQIMLMRWGGWWWCTKPKFCRGVIQVLQITVLTCSLRIPGRELRPGTTTR